MISRALLLGLSFSTLAACSAPLPEPQIASSATEGGYVTGYPEALQSVALRFAQRKGDAKKSEQSFSSYPGQLKDPDWNKVLEIVSAADRVGKSQAYVDRVREVEGAAAFFTSEREEITKKVGGAATFVVKKKGCDVDVYGSVSQALKDSVDKQLEKRLRDASDAQLLVDRYRSSLGKDNAAALDKQADEVSGASYVVHIELVEDKLAIRRLLAEAEQVKKTADEFIAAERAHQSDKGVTDADKKASEDRIAAMNKSKAGLDSAIAQAKSLEPQLEDQIKAAQKEYDDALAALVAALKQKGAK